MRYSLSAFDQCVTRAHARALAEMKKKKRRESMQEWLRSQWESISHILVAFLAVAVLASGLSLFETLVTQQREGVDVSLGTQLGYVSSWLVPTAHAAESYSGLIVSTTPSTQVTVASGEAQEIRVRIQNTGTATWTRDEGAYISLYTKDPNYHVSPYRGPAWRSDHQTGSLIESAVAPGETGTFAFFVYGPPNFEGTLSERFQLAAEETAWIDGGVITVEMTVTAASAAETPQQEEVAETVTDAASSDGYEGLVLIRSAKEITATANQVISFRAGVKNTGTKAWGSYALHDAHTALAATSEEVSFYHPSWSTAKIALAKTDVSVAPGALEFMDFTFRAPHKSGQHMMRFQLVADGLTVPGAVLEVPVEVTSNAAKVVDTPLTEEAEALQVVDLIEEPRIRVGIDQLDASGATFVATSDVRVIESDLGYHRLTIPAGQPMKVAWNGAQYVFESNGEVLLADSYLKFEGVDGADTVFTVTSYDNIRSYNTSLNDNRFRDTMEVRYNTKKDRTWLINELPMEYYLYGIDEATDGAPPEYHKALLTAARTYALYMWEHKTKYKGEFIDVRASTYDQVYHGYGAEIRHPNINAAIDATRGTTIQYDGKTIVAAYFARSDGRTRNWSDVWGGNIAYAVSVPVPCEVGNVKWGHGVGLSQIGAACMAEDEGATFEEILTHFYTGVDLVKRWE